LRAFTGLSDELDELRDELDSLTTLPRRRGLFIFLQPNWEPKTKVVQNKPSNICYPFGQETPSSAS
jgi:hypothetical protein